MSFYSEMKYCGSRISWSEECFINELSEINTIIASHWRNDSSEMVYRLVLGPSREMLITR
jgi:hypothetical protein